SCCSRAEKARVNSSEVICFDISRACNSGMVAKKRSFASSAMRASGLELKRRLDRHGYREGREPGDVRLDAVARLLEFGVRISSRLRSLCQRHAQGQRRSHLASREFHGSLCSSASEAAFVMTALGAVSPVQISNWRTACSINISTPGTTVLPCCRARLMSSVSSGL